MLTTILRASGLVVFLSLVPASEAFSFDVHQFFETKCGRCHQHSGDLARQNLFIDGGVLRSRESGDDIRLFLPDHHGHPDPAETAALYETFIWQVRSGAMFKTKCAICHVRASDLARQSLVRDDDGVRGRYTGVDLGEFLVHHGRIDDDNVNFFVQLFRRLAPKQIPF